MRIPPLPDFAITKGAGERPYVLASSDRPIGAVFIEYPSLRPGRPPRGKPTLMKGPRRRFQALPETFLWSLWEKR
jgi:hypothetical protein